MLAESRSSLLCGIPPAEAGGSRRSVGAWHKARHARVWNWSLAELGMDHSFTSAYTPLSRGQGSSAQHHRCCTSLLQIPVAAPGARRHLKSKEQRPDGPPHGTLCGSGVVLTRANPGQRQQPTLNTGSPQHHHCPAWTAGEAGPHMHAKVGDERLHRQTRGLLYSQSAGTALAVLLFSVMRREGCARAPAAGRSTEAQKATVVAETPAKTSAPPSPAVYMLCIGVGCNPRGRNEFARAWMTLHSRRRSAGISRAKKSTIGVHAAALAAGSALSGINSAWGWATTTGAT